MPGVTWFEDLSPYTYLEQDRGEGMLNVGWLEPGHAYSIGTVPEEATAALATLALDPQRRTRGFHTCGFCGDAGGGSGQVPRGSAEIRVTGADGTRYAAPTLVVHYVTSHGYLPPRGFLEAAVAAAAPQPTPAPTPDGPHPRRPWWRRLLRPGRAG